MTWRVSTCLVVFVIGTFGTACTSNDNSDPVANTGTNDVSNTVTFAARWDGKPGSAKWTAATSMAIDAFGQKLLVLQPSDVVAYCPRYLAAGADERKAFWVGLLSALVRWESNYDPAVSFLEPNVFDANGNRVTSRGLLQISIESGRGYGCTLADEQQLHDPATNLACGVKIMNRLVDRHQVIASDGSPWKGMAAYWSPFRDRAKRSVRA